MSITVKRVLIIAGTIIGAIAIALIIACFPSSNNNSQSGTVTDTVPSEQVADNTNVSDPEDYENMSKDELLKVVEEKDAEIKELMDKVEELTILAEQTTNAIVAPTPVSPSTDDDDDTTDNSTSDGTSPSTGGSTSGNGSSSGNGGTSGSSSGGSPETSDTGL